MFSKLLLLFILVPIIELYLFMKVGDEIGLYATIGIIILTAIIGASLAKQQGQRTLQRFQKATAAGRLPHQEVLDGIMILVAAVVLVTPGFLTDAVGFSLLIPPVRLAVGKFLAAYLKQHVKVVTPSQPQNPNPGPPSAVDKSKTSHIGRDEKIIDAEVIDD